LDEKNAQKKRLSIQLNIEHKNMLEYSDEEDKDDIGFVFNKAND